MVVSKNDNNKKAGQIPLSSNDRMSAAPRAPPHFLSPPRGTSILGFVRIAASFPSKVNTSTVMYITQLRAFDEGIFIFYFKFTVSL